MLNSLRFLSSLILIIYMAAISSFVQANTLYGKNPMLKMQLKNGEVEIELFEADAPKHVERIRKLVSEKFYDGLKFHRVIEGFVAQTGDPKGDGTGGSGQNISAEFNARKHEIGTLSMARAQDIDSADSQFFICLAKLSYLDGNYTVFGKVVKGMEYVNEIKKGDPVSGQVDNPDKIISLREVVNKEESN